MLRYLFLLCVITFGLMAIIGSSSYKPKNFSILSSIPMENISISSYLTIETLYESDKEIILVANWKQVSKSENHTIKWEIYNSNGDSIFTASEKNVSIRPNTYSYFPVLLNKNPFVSEFMSQNLVSITLHGI